MSTNINTIPQDKRLNVFLVYDDAACGVRAFDGFCRVAKKLKADFKTFAWGTDWLLDPSLQPEASGELARAEILAVSVHGDKDLPSTWKEWFGAALKKGGPQRLLIAVVEPGPFSHKIETFLRMIANFQGLDFISNLPRELPPAFQPKQISWSGVIDTVSPLLRPLARPSGQYAHWGINE